MAQVASPAMAKLPEASPSSVKGAWTMTKLTAAYLLGLGLISKSAVSLPLGVVIAAMALSGVRAAGGRACARARAGVRSGTGRRQGRKSSSGHTQLAAHARARPARRRAHARRARRFAHRAQFFVVGVDCSRRSFFPYKALNDFVGFLVLLPLLRSVSSVRESPKVRPALRARRGRQCAAPRAPAAPCRAAPARSPFTPRARAFSVRRAATTC